MKIEEISKKLFDIENLLTNLLFQRSDKPLTLNELAHYTGLSKSTIYKLTSEGKIPHYKPCGKIIYFDKKEVDKWLLNNRVKANNEIEKEALSHTIKGKEEKI